MVQLKIDLPKHFLAEEERCGYVISKEMKQVWAVMLDLLAEFQRICEKYHITYYASGGTMLGAVRHKGFIPWDDDIDVMMYRAEYDKLCEVAPSEFRSPYFFQTEWTDRGSLRGHAQLRNSNTTGILVQEYEQRFHFNQGIFIDIFPIDAVPDDNVKFENMIKRAAYLKKKYLRLSSISDRYYIPGKKGAKSVIKAALHKLFPDTRNTALDFDKYYKEYEDLCCSCNQEHTEKIALLGLQFSKSYLRMRSDFGETIEVPFEFMKINVPTNYDSALRRVYGDYMQFVKGWSIHGGLVLDADLPYTEYLKDDPKVEYHSEVYYHE